MKKINSDFVLYAAFGFPVFMWCTYFKTGIDLNIVNVLKFIFFSPIIEEVLFRWFFQDLLIKKGYKKRSVIITAVFFGLIHVVLSMNLFQLLTAFPAFIIGVHYLKYRDIRYAILLHSIYNSLCFNYAYFF